MKRGILFLFAALLPLAVRAQGVANDPFFTTALPEPDRAEIYTVGYHTVDHLRQAELGKGGASALAALIRAQSVGNFAKDCDLPRYGIKFYSHGKLIAEETICFACQRITPVRSEMHAKAGSEGFDAQTPQAKELQAYLNKTVPLEKE
jgi:hypothetical protein